MYSRMWIADSPGGGKQTSLHPIMIYMNLNEWPGYYIYFFEGLI